MAFSSAEVSLMQQSRLVQEMASLRGWLAAAISNSAVDLESKHASARKELATAINKIDKLPVEVKTGGVHMNYNRLLASDQCTRAVDGKHKAESNHYCEVVAWRSVSRIWK